MRLLQWLGYDIAQREIEIGAVVLAAAFPEHRDHCAHCVFSDCALLFKAAVEGFELGDAGALAHAKFDAAAANQIERRNALGDASWVDGRQLHNAMREADLPRALACRSKKDLRRRRVRILFEEMMLDFPGEVVAEPVRKFELIECIMIKVELAVGFPRPR